jgi:hypothetical protein
MVSSSSSSDIARSNHLAAVEHALELNVEQADGFLLFGEKIDYVMKLAAFTLGSLPSSMCTRHCRGCWYRPATAEACK